MGAENSVVEDVQQEATGLTDDASEVIEEYQNLVYKIAHDLYRNLPDTIDLEDLIGWGYAGLMEAYRRYDATKSTRFATYAYYRIRGAMLDAIPGHGVDAREKVSEIACNEVLNTYAHVVTAQGSQAGIEGRLSRMSDVAGSLALVYVLRDCPEQAMRPGRGPQEKKLVRHQLRDKIRNTVERLPENERKVMRGYYFEGRSLSELAAGLGYSPSWASRIHSRALDRLRGLIENDEDLDDLRVTISV